MTFRLALGILIVAAVVALVATGVLPAWTLAFAVGGIVAIAQAFWQRGRNARA